MSDGDLQVQMLANIGNLMTAFDRFEKRLKDTQGEQKRLNGLARSLQKEVSQGFATEDVDKFGRSVRSSARHVQDFQNEASGGLVNLKQKFQALPGVALAVGGAASAALAGIAAAARSASDKIDEMRRRAAAAAEDSGAKQTAAALAASSLPGVDAGVLLRTAAVSGGTANQDQVNDFVRKLAETSHKEDDEDAQFEAANKKQDAEDKILSDKARLEGRVFTPKPRKERNRRFNLTTNNAHDAVAAFAEFGALPGADEALIDDLKKTGTTANARATLAAQLGAAEAGDPGGIQLLREKRKNEQRRIVAGANDDARTQALSEDIAKTVAAERAVASAGKGTGGQVADALFGPDGFVEDVIDVFTPGSFENRRNDKAAKIRALTAKSEGPMKVEVINHPRAPLDSGY